MTLSQTASDIPSWVYGDPSKPPAFKEKSDAYPLKRLFDISVVLVGLIVSAPLWVVIAIAIKLEDRGPVFFVQECWGKGKTRIQVYKFRTKVPNAIQKFGHIQARENDPRVTRVGKVLRVTSLDEMPQLLNILKGDMSWVGPQGLARRRDSGAGGRG